MAKIKYYEKLKDPRWQRKRLEILERDNFTCRSCYDTERTLHVDHAYYVKDREPWDYPSWALCTLCEDCHKDKHSEAANYFKAWEKLVGAFWDGGPDSADFALEVAWSAQKCHDAGRGYGMIQAAAIEGMDRLSGNPSPL